MKHKNKGSIKTLEVKLEDDHLIELSKWFIKDLEEQFLEKIDANKNNETKLGKYIGNENYIFTPEDITKKSPLTLINAPWGTGKTYFIENLLKLMIDEKIKSDTFKKMIIIDAWKFSSSKDVPIEFIQELALKLIPNNETENIKKETVKNFWRKIAPTSVSLSLNFPFVWIQASKDTNINKEDIKKAEKIFNDVQNNKIPTIIFIDNLERLGSLSWDLLKAIIKLQEFTNFLIVLPLNLNKLKNEKIDTAEYPIEKYVDFHYYDFKQDYDNYFKKHFTSNDQLINNLNKIFNAAIDGEKLTIREVKKSFESNKILTMDDDYEIFKKIKKSIWSPETTFEEISRAYLDSFLDIEKRKRDLYEDVCLELRKKHNDTIIYEPSILTEEGFEKIIASDNKYYYYTINSNHIDIFKIIKKDIDTRENELSVEIKKLGKDIEKHKDRIIKLKKFNTKLEQEIQNLESEKVVEKNKGDEDGYSSDKIVNIEKNILEKNNKIGSNNSEIGIINNAIIELENSKTTAEEIRNKITLNMDDKIREYETIISDNKFSEFAKEEMTWKLNLIEDISSKFSTYEKIEDILELENIIKDMI